MSENHNSDAAAESPRWQLIERAVTVLEKILAPGAEVLHNQKLPELVTGTLRQCDVVIRAGAPPRQTLTIVEVQDRDRNVDLATYEGWCQKREKLDAQHLICVSVSGFPESVQHDAALRGNTVRLMTLTEPDEFPWFFRAREIPLGLNARLQRQVEPIFEPAPAASLSVAADAKVFQADEEPARLSLDEIVDAAWNAERVSNVASTPLVEPPNHVRRTYELALAKRGPSFSVVIDGERLTLVGARIVELYERHEYVIPLTMLGYEQIGYGGTLAWVILATGQHDGHTLSIRLPVAIIGGALRIGRAEISGVPGTVTSVRTGVQVSPSSAEERAKHGL